MIKYVYVFDYAITDNTESVKTQLTSSGFELVEGYKYQLALNETTSL